MNETWLKVIDKYGFPTFFCLACMMALAWEARTAAHERATADKTSAEERATYTALLIDQISDLRTKTANAMLVCAGSHGQKTAAMINEVAP